MGLRRRLHTAACEAALGPIPAIDCDASVLVPVVPLSDGTCDRPSLISGCTPGSRAGSARNAQGSVFHWVCRHIDPATPGGWYDDIALIGHDPARGAACFWGAPADGARRSGAMPHPGDDDGYWAELPELAELRCRACHDNDPILVTPWYEASGVVDNDPLAPFTLLFADELEALAPGGWRPGWRLVHPEAAPCTTCHRLTSSEVCTFGEESTGRGHAPLASEAARRWPLDRWMDTYDPIELVARYPDEAAWEATYGVAADTVAACCAGELPPLACWAE